MKKDKVLLKRRGKKEKFAKRSFKKMKFISSNNWSKRNKKD